ncbi:hypothetical protein SK803_14415 [Lentzea sp. BCCO 10_0856]|uniref:Uncharacterized protein n=1 Tax=Lentzea miocenica TaxID=3095431 RepID=A0ABU4SZR9_9PSEU|nr:hypothetical protein [Lentzea sp. BCCO 10_0856]MDX8031417.1 hypothetical protein [Lentzea sp. BCCO 10_0856]
MCQRSGQNIYGNKLWDYIVYSGGEGFMSDYYVNTGHANCRSSGRWRPRCR